MQDVALDIIFNSLIKKGTPFGAPFVKAYPQVASGRGLRKFPQHDHQSIVAYRDNYVNL